MNCWVSKVFSLPSTDAYKLSDFLFKKTRGNILHVNQILEAFHTCNFLQFSQQNLKWTLTKDYDIERIFREHVLAHSFVKKNEDRRTIDPFSDTLRPQTKIFYPNPLQKKLLFKLRKDIFSFLSRIFEVLPQATRKIMKIMSLSKNEFIVDEDLMRYLLRDSISEDSLSEISSPFKKRKFLRYSIFNPDIQSSTEAKDESQISKKKFDETIKLLCLPASRVLFLSPNRFIECFPFKFFDETIQEFVKFCNTAGERTKLVQHVFKDTISWFHDELFPKSPGESSICLETMFFCASLTMEMSNKQIIECLGLKNGDDHWATFLRIINASWEEYTKNNLHPETLPFMKRIGPMLLKYFSQNETVAKSLFTHNYATAHKFWVNLSQFYLSMSMWGHCEASCREAMKFVGAEDKLVPYVILLQKKTFSKDFESSSRLIQEICNFYGLKWEIDENDLNEARKAALDNFFSNFYDKKPLSLEDLKCKPNNFMNRFNILIEKVQKTPTKDPALKALFAITKYGVVSMLCFSKTSLFFLSLFPLP